MAISYYSVVVRSSHTTHYNNIEDDERINMYSIIEDNRRSVTGIDKIQIGSYIIIASVGPGRTCAAERISGDGGGKRSSRKRKRSDDGGSRLEYLIGPKLPNSIAHEIRKRCSGSGSSRHPAVVVVVVGIWYPIAVSTANKTTMKTTAGKRVAAGVHTRMEGIFYCAIL